MRTIEQKAALGEGVRDFSLPPLPRRVREWSSPPGQPSFARPTLLAIAGLAALAYAWGAESANLEPFYGAAARSMSESWHDFLFGAFDPRGTATVDKLPGALWMQALSLRVLGFHVWAVVLPQIIEGVLTVLVLYRAVRRLAGTVAGLVAALVLAASPVTVALGRGNVSDSFLILLTVIAADATSAAIVSGRLRTLLLAGVWVGLAFQAKMIQAWLVLPALALAYVLSAPGPLQRRMGHVALACLVTFAVSLSWMSVVSLVPNDQRPYVDGTTNDSVFSQVFSYNGISRLEHGKFKGAGPPAPFLIKQLNQGEGINGQTFRIGASWHRLLTGPLGRDDGWLLPAAVLSAAAVLLRRRRASRRDRLRASVVLWASWLLVLAVVFSAGRYLNSYYVAALSPATAALCGAGVELLWRERHRPAARRWLAASVFVSAVYGAYLVRGGNGVPIWLLLALLAGVIASGAALLMAFSAPPRAAAVRMAAVAGCALLPAASTSALSVARRLGPFDTPYGPTISGHLPINQQRYAAVEQHIVHYFRSRFHTQIAFATDTSLLASLTIFYTGQEVLPIGGYAGGIPAPTLRELRRYIADGNLRVILIPVKPASNDPRIIWIRTHCAVQHKQPARRGVELAFYECDPKVAA
jgi:4-amino-4-deoxy-L-arabinose transferase-like glycosyltransferase